MMIYLLYTQTKYPKQTKQQNIIKQQQQQQQNKEKNKKKQDKNTLFFSNKYAVLLYLQVFFLTTFSLG